MKGSVKLTFNVEFEYPNYLNYEEACEELANHCSFYINYDFGEIKVVNAVREGYETNT